MKRKLLSLLGCVLLMTVLLSVSVSASYSLTEVDQKDKVYRGNLIDVSTATRIPFNYEVPENGAAVIYFYKTTCPMSQQGLSALNEQSWAHNERIKLYAIESTGENGVAEIRDFQKVYTPNIAEIVTWLDSGSANLCADYLGNAGLYNGGWTWPAVIVITEENGVNTIRAADTAVTDVRRLGNTLEKLLKTDLGIPDPAPLTITAVHDYDKAASLVELVNQRREENGLAPLHHNKALTEAAMARAAEAALFQSDSRPDATGFSDLLADYMPNADVSHCTVGFSCNTPEAFWECYVEPINFDRWFHTEYQDSGVTQIGVGCVFFNNNYYWALATAAEDSSANEAADQSGQAAKSHTIPTYLSCLDAPGLYPSQITLYLGDSAEIALYGNTKYIHTPLIPAACDSEIRDSSGQTIATAALQEDGTISVTATAVGTGELHAYAWEGQETPYTAEISVTDDPAYRPNALHTVVDGSGRIQLSHDTAVQETWVTISLIPDEGWWTAAVYIKDAEGRDVDCYYTGEDEYMISMPMSDVTVTAKFLPDSVPQTRYSIDKDITGDGSISVFGDAYAATTVTVTAEGKNGHVLKSLTATDADGNPVALTPNPDGSHSFQMPAANVTLYALFAPAGGYAVTVETAHCCTVTPTPANANPGETVTVTVIPHEGYEIRDFIINLWEDEFTWADENTLTFSMPTYDVEITVYCIPSAVTSGSLGDELTWSFADGELTISGIGSMGAFDSSWDVPWNDRRDEIQTVIIKEGVTDITEYALSYLDNLTAVTIPSSVECIEGRAFLNDGALTDITFTGSAPSRGIEDFAFTGVSAFVNVPANDRSWTQDDTQDYGGTLMWNHSWSAEVIAPACTEGGYTRYSCVCGDSDHGDETEPLGHVYTGGICTRCGEADPDYVKPVIKNPFTDVAETDWFYAPVLWAVENNVTGGTSPTTFSPSAPCTRGQVVTFLWAANGKPAPAGTDHPFTDVSDTDYYYSAVLWAVENGITGGTSPTTFSPNDPCTRAHVVTFLWAAKGKPAPQNTVNTFTDVDNGAYYAKAVLWAAENDITGGVGEGLFGPDQGCTRNQIVTFLYKAAMK